MIATNEAVDVLRHGWQDAASSLAADVPEVADLLKARLELAISEGRLDEAHLLSTIEEVETVTGQSRGGPGEALARRLRRTVYEYLLALDAARPVETVSGVAGARSASGGPAVGTEEIATLGHATSDVELDGAVSSQQAATPSPDDPETDAELLAEEAVGSEPRGPRRRFVLRLRHNRPDERATTESDEAAASEQTDATVSQPEAVALVADVGAAPREPEASAAEPEPAGTHAIPEPNAVAPDGDAAVGLQDTAAPLTEPEAAAHDAHLAVDEPAAPVAQAPDIEAVAEAVTAPEHAPLAEPPESQPADVEPGAAVSLEPAPSARDSADASITSEEEQAFEEDGPTVAPQFVAPRAGFHIVDNSEPVVRQAPEAGPASAEAQSDETAPVIAAMFGASHSGTVPEASAPPAVEFLAWDPPADSARQLDVASVAVTTAALPAPDTSAPTLDAATAPVPPVEAVATPTPPLVAVSAPAPPLDAGVPAAAAPQPSAEVAPGPDEDDGESRGWRVRDSRPGARKRGTVSVAAAPEAEDDPFGINPKLAELRRRIEDRLRRKRCDEAAALMQALAQETGGRAVADLAMNAGDRCRALGKSNAALNCYLAASRSDPVYELPLGRLADVCIDAQETDLAVTYLERIARLYRYRGDEKDALRVYRRIATIAPYREDVLAILLNAQRSGRLD